jgi:hypothetical protein
MLTGCGRGDWVRFIVTELVFNALDKKDVNNVTVDVHHEDGQTIVSVKDDGEPQFTKGMLEKVINFYSAPSSKRGLKRITRGIRGNALQSCAGISYTSWDNDGRPKYTFEVRGDAHYLVHIAHEGNAPKNAFQSTGKNPRRRETELIFRLQGGKGTYHSPETDVQTIQILNQHARIVYREDGHEKPSVLMNSALNTPLPVVSPPSIWYYSVDEFRHLISEWEGGTVTSFVSVFKGLSGTKIAKQVREEAGIDERTALSQLDEEKTRRLYELMRRRSKSIKNASLPSVGRKAFANGGYWKGYAMKKGVFRDGEGRTIPFLVEGAARQSSYPEIIEAVNFASSLGAPFTGFAYRKSKDRPEQTTLNDILKGKDVGIILHLVCPAISWRNPAKGQLDIVPFMQQVLDVTRALVRERHKSTGDLTETVELAKDLMNRFPNMVFSLRQLFYQAIALKQYPNTRGSYNKFSKALVRGREMDEIDYKRIADFSRPEYFNDPEETSPEKELQRRLRSLVQDFNVNVWKGQPSYVEVWIEKEALSRIIDPICRKYNVNLIVGRGYSSYSQVRKAIDRMPELKHVRIFYLGDHDPTGLHIQEKLEARIRNYSTDKGKNIDLEFKRLALTYDQVKERSLVPSSLKKAAQKAKEYKRQFGDQVWELDALPPDVIPKLVEDAILTSMDQKLWQQNRRRLEKFRRDIAKKLESTMSPNETRTSKSSS